MYFANSTKELVLEKKVRLASYNNNWYKTGRGPIIRLLWYVVNAVVLNSYLFPISGLKVFFLRLFGAKIGKEVVIKPKVNIKYPWKLSIGDYCWIGEKVWIDNLAEVKIAANCCLSQGAILLCGNHNYKKSTFDLIVLPITLEEGAWVGSQSVVSPGVTLKSHAVLSVLSVANKDMEAYTIYQGNPALPVKKREIK